MKTKTAVTSSTSSNSVEGVEESHSKKRRVSDERLQINAAETQLPIVVYDPERDPVAHHKKRKSCRSSKPRGKRIRKETTNYPKPPGTPTGVTEAQMAMVVYTCAAEPISVKRMKKPREKIHNGPNRPPGIPNRFKEVIERMGGTDFRLVIQKGLSETDLSRSHNRLSMPSKMWIADQDLSSQLLMMIENGSKSRNNVSLPLMDTKMRLWGSVSLRMWNMKRPMVVIAGEWNDLAEANELKVKDVVQIWCFKFIETGSLGMAMVKIESGNSSNDSNSSYLEITIGSNVAAPDIRPDAQASSSTGSSNYSCLNNYPSTSYFDFLKVGSSNECDTLQECVQIAGSDSSSVNVTTLNNESNELGGSSTEAVLFTVTDTSSSDIDLTLHL